jgi:hypothetical protein
MPHPLHTPVEHLCGGCPKKAKKYRGHRRPLELHESAEITTSSTRVIKKRVLEKRGTSRTCTRHGFIRIRRFRSWSGTSNRGRTRNGWGNPVESSSSEDDEHCQKDCRIAYLSKKISSIFRKIDSTIGYSHQCRRPIDHTRSCLTTPSWEKQDGDMESS